MTSKVVGSQTEHLMSSGRSVFPIQHTPGFWEGQDTEHRSPTRQFQHSYLCCKRVIPHIYVSLPPVCTSMANEENYPNTARFHSQTEIPFFTRGRKCGREPPRLNQHKSFDVMRGSTLMPHSRQASLHIPCNYGEAVSYRTNYGMSACMYQM